MDEHVDKRRAYVHSVPPDFEKMWKDADLAEYPNLTDSAFNAAKEFASTVDRLNSSIIDSMSLVPSKPKPSRFQLRTFSRRFPAVECAITVVHLPAKTTCNTIHMHDPRKCLHSRGVAAAITDTHGYTWTGATFCSPRDQFKKKTGRAIAIGRAFSAYVGERDSPDCVDAPLKAIAAYLRKQYGAKE